MYVYKWDKNIKDMPITVWGVHINNTPAGSYVGLGIWPSTKPLYQSICTPEVGEMSLATNKAHVTLPLQD